MKFKIIINLLSITMLSTLDVVFDLNRLPKSTMFAGVWVFFVMLFLWSLFTLAKNFVFESKYYKYAFWTFFLYGLVTVIRGWTFAPADLTSYLRVSYIFWPFLMPLYTFIDKKMLTMSFIMECLYYIGLGYLAVAIVVPHLLLYRPTAEPIAFALALGCEFVLLNAMYMSNKKTNVSFLVVLLSVLSLVYLARRSAALLFAGIIGFSYLFALFSNRKPFIYKMFPFLIVAGVIVFFSVDKFSKSLTSNLNQRMNEDTRTDVINNFMIDMRNDMTFGKGMNGRYYCPVGGGGVHDDGMEWEAVDYRDTIENGYLQLVLSGGIVHLVLFLLICIPAMFSGIFRSSNYFARSCGVIILLWLIYMFAFGQPNISVGYMLVWISIGVCYTPGLRNKTDLEIMLEMYPVPIELVPHEDYKQ